jgi:hypothetical protein
MMHDPFDDGRPATPGLPVPGEADPAVKRDPVVFLNNVESIYPAVKRDPVVFLSRDTPEVLEILYIE